MKQKTILFFTVEPGIAHITRSLSIAEELKKRGHRVVFAITKTKQYFIKKVGIEVVDAPVSLEEGLSAVAVERWKDENFLLSLAREEIKIIKRFSPNVGVADFRASAVVSLRSLNIPTAFISGSAGLPYGCRLPNPGYPSWLHSLISPLLQQAIWKGKLPFYKAMISTGQKLGLHQQFDQLFYDLTYIVPEVKGYLRQMNSALRVNHVSPLFWKGFEEYAPSWIDTIQPDGSTIYLSFGGTGYDGRKLIELSSLLIEHGYRVVVSSGNIAPLDKFPKHKNLFVEKFLPGQEICKRVDLVICHGGYGTMMQAVLAGKPIVAVPFNPDQLLYAYRFQELGLGRALVKLSPHIWLHLEWGAFENLGKSIQSTSIIKAVQSVFRTYSRYTHAIRKFSKTIPVNGVIKAAEVIEQIQ